jgi:hypothetical protein
MPWQLIYTSAPRGLKPGQTGFCTVACSENLREIIVQRLERWSVYHHLTLQASTTGISNPIIAVYRILDLRDEKYHVLSRIQDAGQDFTLRSNHLAHHLVFSSAELLEMPSPAAILLLWKGWRNRWDGPPTLLGAHETQDLSELRETRLLPARNWQQMTGDAASAAGFLGLEHKRVIFVTAPGHEQMLLALYAEALQLLDPVGQSPLSAWQYPFTTFLQAEDALSEFYWRGGLKVRSARALLPWSRVRFRPGIRIWATLRVRGGLRQRKWRLRSKFRNPRTSPNPSFVSFRNRYRRRHLRRPWPLRLRLGSAQPQLQSV